MGRPSATRFTTMAVHTKDFNIANSASDTFDTAVPGRFMGDHAIKCTSATKPARKAQASAMKYQETETGLTVSWFDAIRTETGELLDTLKVFVIPKQGTRSVRGISIVEVNKIHPSYGTGGSQLGQSEMILGHD